MRPGRPMPGRSASISTWRIISSTVSIAESALSRLMYCSTESRSRLAACVHFSRTFAFPPFDHGCVFDQPAAFGFLQRLSYLADEPLLVVEVAFDRLIDHPCPRAADRIRESVDAFEGATLHADRGCFFGAH